MIKVNLISVTPGQSAAAAPREWLPKEQRNAAVGLVLLLSTAIGITTWWGYLRHERSKVETNIAAAEAELVKLKAVAQLVDRATARKAELADRIDLIERLRSTMRGPVRLMETVSHSVPHGLWLLEIKQVGSTAQMEGRSMSMTSVYDFAGQMDQSGFFSMPVDISTTAEVVEDTPVIRFVMKAEVAIIQGPKPSATTTPATPANSTAPAAPAAGASKTSAGGF